MCTCKACPSAEGTLCNVSSSPFSWLLVALSCSSSFFKERHSFIISFFSFFWYRQCTHLLWSHPFTYCVLSKSLMAVALHMGCCSVTPAVRWRSCLELWCGVLLFCPGDKVAFIDLDFMLGSDSKAEKPGLWFFCTVGVPWPICSAILNISGAWSMKLKLLRGWQIQIVL